MNVGAFLGVAVLVIVTPGPDTALTIGHALRAGEAAPPPGTPEPRPLASLTAYRRGLLSNLANPKMVVFFVSLLPQFGHTSFAALLGLGLLFSAMTFTWLTAYAVVTARAGDLLRGTRVRRVLDAATGVVLVGLGIRLATERRP